MWKKARSFFFFGFIIVYVVGCTQEGHNTDNREGKTVSNAEAINNDTAKEELLIKTERDYSEYFNGMEGCAVFLNSQDGFFDIYNADLADSEESPCSTFKIISTLIGLKNGIITDSDSRMNYDGTQYSVEEWNRDLTLKQAFQSSCIWYFREVIDAVGMQEVKQELEGLDYGNRDISQWEGSHTNPMPKLNGFWLESSLKITPVKQTEVIEQIFEGETIYTEYLPILKEIMLVDGQGRNYQLYGKMGSGGKGLGWFSGMAKGSQEEIYFTVFLPNGTGKQAKEIVDTILSEQYMPN